METACTRLCVPARSEFARSVRLLAASLAATCGMSVDEVEDVRMVAEEGFVYACATNPEQIDVAFELSQGAVVLEVSLGDEEPQDGELELVEVLLSSLCEEFFVSEDGRTLHLRVRALTDAAGDYDVE